MQHVNMNRVTALQLGTWIQNKWKENIGKTQEFRII